MRGTSGAENANNNAINQSNRLNRIESNVREDVRSGELSPKEGAQIIAQHRRGK